MQDKFTEVANKITTIKTGFAEAITAKGVETLPSASFGDMITNIGNITGGGGSGPVVYDGWIKPYDWPDIEAEPLEDAYETRMLFCDLFNDTPEEIALKHPQSANVLIDWGDGTEPEEVDNSMSTPKVVSHTFNPNGGVYCESIGCRVYIVKIKRQSGSFPTIIVGKNSKSSSTNITNSGLLWFYGNHSDANVSGLFGNSYSFLSMCQRVRLTLRTPPTCSYMFRGLTGLISLVSNHAFNVSGSLTSISNIFAGCKSLLKTPPIDTSKVQGSSYNNSNHFSGCTSLLEIGTVTLASNIKLEIKDKAPVLKIDLAYNEAKPPVFTETVPIKINYTQLNADALNKLMTQLPDGNGKTLDLKYNPGSATCDPSIATAKNWTVLV